MPNAPGPSTTDDAIELDDAALREWPLPLPSGEGDKEKRGRVLVVAGSREIPGAAVLAATGALRAGAGKVAIAAPASIAQAIAFAVPESRVIALEESADGGIAARAANDLEALASATGALLIGPGLPYHDHTHELAASLLDLFAGCGVVLDAGAMAVVRLRGRFERAVLLTPHAGEMASLTGENKEDIAAEPMRTARTTSRKWNAVIALKGAVTHIAAPDGRVWRNHAGNVGLATSGSGDVLAGIMAGLIARGAPLEQAGAWGVALHARAGARLAERVGPLGYLARELPGEVPRLMVELAP
jgi:hydroxyethylthiazole kinase-like uncharacterized protein yjeF